MRIGIFTFSFPPDVNGVSRVTYAHAAGFAKHGHSVVVVTSKNPFRDFLSIEKEGITVREYDVKGWRRYTGEIQAYQEYLLDNDLDVILFHCWQSWPVDLAMPVLPFVKVPKILVSHGISANMVLSPRAALTWVAWRPYVCRLLRFESLFDHIVFLSDHSDRNRFYDRRVALKAKLKNISVIPNGGSVMPSQQTTFDFRKAFNISGSKVILSVGEFSPLKNQRMALDVFLACACGDSTLVLIGTEENKYSLELLSDIERRRRGKDIVLLTGLSRSEVEAAYLAADLFIHTSRSEVQPLVILDAMSASLPFISTDVGCVRELPGGLVATSKADFTRKLEFLLTNETERNRLGMEGFSAFKSKYNWEYVIAEYEKLLLSVMNNQYSRSKTID
jgi:glycosyltransferase involved in cell wall biosynthesis